MAGTLPLCATSTASDPESRDSTVVLLLNFDSILKKNVCLIMEYAQLYKKQKDVSMFHKDVSPRGCQKYVSIGFWSRTYKSTRIGECTGVQENYSISELKRCRENALQIGMY